jgi:hypothetical protein
MGERYFEKFIIMSIGLIFAVFVTFTLMNDVEVGGDPKTAVIIPVALFGIGHAMFTTI